MATPAPTNSIQEFHSTENFPSQKSILNHLNTKCVNSLQNLKQTHALVLKTGHFQDHYIAGTLLKCYTNPQFNDTNYFLLVLAQVSDPNVFVYNFAIKGCLDIKEAADIYRKMVVSGTRPNKYTYPPLLKGCAIENAVSEGLQIYAHVVKYGFSTDKHVISSGINMYVSFGCVREARSLFNLIGNFDVVCCNAMIDGYMKYGNVDDSVKLFDEMIEKSVGSWNKMITGFFNSGMVEEAVRFFNEMPEKDEVTWSSMIDGFNRVGCFKEGLEVFIRMQEEGIRPTKFSLSSALASCANVAALEQGKWIHGYVKKNKGVLDPVLGTSLIDMYAKCGRLDLCWDIFETMEWKEVFTWNAMIGGLALHGRADDAIEMFMKMQKHCLKPNGITFVSLLSSCAHGGFIDEGLEYFITMKEKYGVEPTIEHYGCVVNLLGKAGFFDEAEDLIRCMPMEANSAVWGALLGACRTRGNVELAEKVGEILLELEPENSGRYALLSNIYAKARRWNSVENLRKLMKERGVKTVEGTSLIELNGTIHEFKVGDLSHNQMKEIYIMLEKIIEKIQLKGHKPDTSQVLFDINEEEKETSLKYHSEKLAITFGIMNTKPGATIRVVKNLRMCEDCHSAAKVISEVYGREIIMRDRVRYHHFRRGSCSCKDFW